MKRIPCPCCFVSSTAWSYCTPSLTSSTTECSQAVTTCTNTEPSDAGDRLIYPIQSHKSAPVKGLLTAFPLSHSISHLIPGSDCTDGKITTKDREVAVLPLHPPSRVYSCFMASVKFEVSSSAKTKQRLFDKILSLLILFSL